MDICAANGVSLVSIIDIDVVLTYPSRKYTQANILGALVESWWSPGGVLVESWWGGGVALPPIQEPVKYMCVSGKPVSYAIDRLYKDVSQRNNHHCTYI